jgi:hypothetical protein
VLKFLDFIKPFEVHTNASDFTINGMFMQDGHSIAFESKKLYGAQLRWPTHEKELYVVIRCLKAWQRYLGTHKTNISLQYFET